MLKYQHAKQQILEKVYKLSPGRPLPAVRTLIKELGYSQVTLKRAFDELEAEGILRREKGAGIFVAELKNNSSLVGVIMPPLGPKMYSQLLLGIQEELIKSDINLLLLPCHCAKLDTIYESIKINKLTNLIINPSSEDLSNIDFINFMHKISDDGINIVIIDIPVPGLKTDYIGFENKTAFAKLTQKIIVQGAKDITVVGKFDSKVYFSRVKVIRDVINGSGIKLRQIDVNDNSLQQIAVEIAESQADAVILCDAGTSVNLAYELKSSLSKNTRTMQIGGIVEQNECLPCENAITLQKENIVMGRIAAEMLLRKKDKSEVKLLPIKIIA